MAVRVSHADEASGQAAVEAAFGEIAEVHRLMSFHEPRSDLSRVNRRGSFEAARVDELTARVLAFAVELARQSDGAFDPCVGGRAVEAGDLPPPPDAPRPDRHATWRDILLQGSDVRLSRPAWLDLGGIAKGFAVDRAIDRLRALGVSRACVNAGGDLRVIGDQSEAVLLRAGAPDTAPVIEVSDGALASSGGGASLMARHFDGADEVARRRFACVAARTCMVADALTKVVLARGEGASALLADHRAAAWLFDPEGGWQSIGAAS